MTLNDTEKMRAFEKALQAFSMMSRGTPSGIVGTAPASLTGTDAEERLQCCVCGTTSNTSADTRCPHCGGAMTHI